MEQQHIQIREEQKEQSKAQEVNKKDNADKEQKKYDAKEKGSNEYIHHQKKKKKEKKENLPDGSVKIKQTMSGGFDIKI